MSALADLPLPCEHVGDERQFVVSSDPEGERPVKGFYATSVCARPDCMERARRAVLYYTERLPHVYPIRPVVAS